MKPGIQQSTGVSENQSLLSDWTLTERPKKVALKKRIKAEVSQWVWLFRSLLWKLNQSCRWPWVPEPSRHDCPASWGPDDPAVDPLRWRALGAAFGAKAAGVKGTLRKGCRLYSSSASICFGDFLFFAPQAFSRSIELPSNFLFSQKRLGVERRKCFSPLLFPCPPPWGCASEVFHLSFYTLGELPSTSKQCISSSNSFLWVILLKPSVIFCCMAPSLFYLAFMFFLVIMHLWVTLALKTSIDSLWDESLGRSLFCLFSRKPTVSSSGDLFRFF